MTTQPAKPSPTTPPAAAWRKSSYSNPSGGNCLETATRPNGITLRDSKNPTTGSLTFSEPAWTNFIHNINNGAVHGSSPTPDSTPLS
jgi:hypothetical protein